MTKWKHRDSELDRTCGIPRPVVFVEVDEMVCGACDSGITKLDEWTRIITNPTAKEKEMFRRWGQS